LLITIFLLGVRCSELNQFFKGLFALTTVGKLSRQTFLKVFLNRPAKMRAGYSLAQGLPKRFTGIFFLQDPGQQKCRLQTMHGNLSCSTKISNCFVGIL